jgi:hypothetical protein
LKRLALLLLIGCQGSLDAPAPSASLDPNFFRCRVQPVLVKNCSAFLCHGDARRFLRVYGRDRLRYGIAGEDERNRALSPAEIEANFESASAFVDGVTPDQSLIVLKPLETDAGGYFHRGAEIFGQGNVFAAPGDPDLDVIRQWAHGAKENDTCVEPGSMD